MDTNEVERFIKGLVKKHDKDFSISLKYQSNSGKVRKRHGRFVELKEGFELVLYNSDKDTEGRYLLDRIVDIKKK
jgi:hypothetical protein